MAAQLIKLGSGELEHFVSSVQYHVKFLQLQGNLQIWSLLGIHLSAVSLFATVRIEETFSSFPNRNGWHLLPHNNAMLIMFSVFKKKIYFNKNPVVRMWISEQKKSILYKIHMFSSLHCFLFLCDYFRERLVAVTLFPALILWLCLIDWVEEDQPDVCVCLCLCVRFLFTLSKKSVLQQRESILFMNDSKLATNCHDCDQ